jgi:hypothetical protein
MCLRFLEMKENCLRTRIYSTGLKIIITLYSELELIHKLLEDKSVLETRISISNCMRYAASISISSVSFITFPLSPCIRCIIVFYSLKHH